MRVFLHNPRCSKSRDALKLMTKSGKNFVLRNYIKAPLDIGELEDLQKKLWLNVIEFTRTNESEFKEFNLTKNSTDTEILKIMSKHPKLMQRPIVYDENKAVLWRPDAENILNIFKK